MTAKVEAAEPVVLAQASGGVQVGVGLAGGCGIQPVVGHGVLDVGDYRLKTGSPAIGPGKRFEDLKEDLEGHQRGLKNSSGARGDGSHTDIGAYEALPRPVAVWLRQRRRIPHLAMV